MLRYVFPKNFFLYNVRLVTVLNTQFTCHVVYVEEMPNAFCRTRYDMLFGDFILLPANDQTF